MAAQDREEQYVLRVSDRALAERIRGVLRSNTDQQPEDLHLNFQGMRSFLLFLGVGYQPLTAGKPIAGKKTASGACLALIQASRPGQLAANTGHSPPCAVLSSNQLVRS